MRQGARVAFCQRSDGSAFAAAMEEATGARPLDLRCDLTDVAALRATLARAAEAHGPVTRLVCNAADDDRHAALDVTEAYWDRNQAINLRSYFFAAQAVIPAMREAGGGAIVNFSSISYMMGNAGYASYTAANAGITGLTRSLAREFGGDGVRVNALAPGWVLTEKQREMWATEEGLAAHHGPPVPPPPPRTRGRRGPLPVPRLRRLGHGHGPGARRRWRRGGQRMSARRSVSTPRTGASRMASRAAPHPARPVRRAAAASQAGRRADGRRRRASATCRRGGAAGPAIRLPWHAP